MRQIARRLDRDMGERQAGGQHAFGDQRLERIGHMLREGGVDGLGIGHDGAVSLFGEWGKAHSRLARRLARTSS